jgi:uncharacterized protein
MDLTGSQKIKASQQNVFQALFNPEILQHCVPNCNKAEYVDTPNGREMELSVNVNIPGLKGTFMLYLRTEEVIEPSHLVIITEPNSSVGSIKARCAVDLLPDGDTTLLNYAATADMSGKVAAIPEIVFKPILKGGIDHLFKNLEKQLN